jgi:hypothetical protein
MPDVAMPDAAMTDVATIGVRAGLPGQQRPTPSGSAMPTQVMTDAALWRRLSAAEDMKAFSSAWLKLLCAQIDLVFAMPGTVTQAMVALGDPLTRRYARTAWHGTEGEVSLLLTKAGERAMQMRHGAVQRAESPNAASQVAYPLLVGEALHGVVALELVGVSADQLDLAMRLAQWGAAWFAAAWQAPRAAQARQDAPAGLLTEALACCLGARRVAPAAEALATLLADRLAADKVAIGTRRGLSTRLLALSHGGFASIRNDYLSALLAAMDEAADAGHALSYPQASGDLATPHAAQARLCRAHDSGWVITLPIAPPKGTTRRDSVILLIEGSGVPPDGLQSALGALAEIVAPLISLRLAAEQSLPGRLGGAVSGTLHNIRGSRPGLHHSIIAGLVLLPILLAFLPVPYNVAVDATLESGQRRAIISPFDGYLAEARVRPGDRVTAGTLLGRFDTRELQHQRMDSAERLSETEREINEAVGLLDRAKASVLAAHKAQIEAELALLDEQLSHAELRAPFDGFVVSGDKTQSIGAPMHRGDLLYELSPLADFRVALEVPQEDFATVAIGQSGRLVLTALPYRSLPFHLVRITAIAAAHDGKSVLRAEADLDQTDAELRPGMQGVADIAVGRARLGWLLTHRITAWLALKTWAWLP